MRLRVSFPVAVLAGIALVFATRPCLATLLTSSVDPFIGTGGHGHTFPGPQAPFGMVQVGPDTRLEGWDGCSGYHFSDSLVYGFSHTHLSGTGVGDYCDVLLMPATGERRLRNGADGTPGYRSRFEHARERARPGFYAVDLLDHGVHVELTATERVAMHRYTFPARRAAHVILDLTHRDAVLASSIRFVGDREIEGVRRSRSWAQDQTVAFVIRFSRPWTSFGIARGDTEAAGLREAEGRALKAWADFGDAGGPLIAKVALSPVDAAGARANLDAEIPGWDFAAVLGAADRAWERELGKIRVEGGTARERRTFYTALYQAMLAPNLFQDADGRYRGRDLAIHHADFRYSTVFSLWDTFRALHPLLAVMHRERTRDFVRTFLRQYQEGGRLPVWELAANETDCMIGYHAVPVIADAIAKGITGFDPDLALDAMRHSAGEDRRGLASYKKGGFVAGDEEGESVSKTLEYAYDDWCIAESARRLGRADVAAEFERRAGNWRNLFDPSTGFMRARLWGLWFSPFDPRQVNVHFTEGNSWQYSWFVPHDLSGLMRVHGGDRAFAKRLDAFFSADSRLTGNSQPDITGLIGQYAHGNEPGHHIPYLYAYAGEPWKTQALVRQIRDSLYSDLPDGLPGNEDCGQMSAWYVLAALGFYPVTPGSDTYVLGTPLFDRATITLENGRRFTIVARRTRPGASFVESTRLGGRPSRRSWIRHADLANGGELVFELADRPSATWGVLAADRPVSALRANEAPPVPFVSQGAAVFRDRNRVDFGVADSTARIEVASGGGTFAAWKGPLEIRETRTLKAVAVGINGARSPALEATFSRLPEGRTIRLGARYNGQYSAGGDDALIDGLRGGNNFRNGRWQGYQGTDLDVTVDLGRTRRVRRASIGFLQDAWPWIFMPADVSYAISRDGRRWRDVGRVANPVPDDETDVVTREFEVSFAPAEARYVRARIRSRGSVPEWHPGKGSPAFFFADEFTIE